MTLPLPANARIRVILVEDDPLDLCGIAKASNGLTNLEWTAESRLRGDDAGANLVSRQCPHEAGVHTVGRASLDGLPGFLADSLPDAWGRLLIDRQLRSRNINPAALSGLDRLAIVGDRGPGALVFAPQADIGSANDDELDLDVLSQTAQVVLVGGEAELLDELVRAGGSAGGSRPKAWVAEAPDGTLRSGAHVLDSEEVGWLVKFRAPSHDPEDIGALEMAYAQMALAAGLDVAEPRLFETASGRYFASRRFDRESGRRIHVVTAAGLLNVHAAEAMAADYVDLLKMTRYVTRSEPETLEAFRNAAFNVLAHNRDDHLKQFAFRRVAGAWRRTPAYDLTFNEGPRGEHTLLVAGEGKNPGNEELARLADRAGLDASDAKAVVDEVTAAVNAWPAHAAAAEVSSQTAGEVWTRLQQHLTIR